MTEDILVILQEQFRIVYHPANTEYDYLSAYSEIDEESD